MRDRIELFLINRIPLRDEVVERINAFVDESNRRPEGMSQAEIRSRTTGMGLRGIFVLTLTMNHTMRHARQAGRHTR